MASLRHDPPLGAPGISTACRPIAGSVQTVAWAQQRGVCMRVVVCANTSYSDGFMFRLSCVLFDSSAQYHSLQREYPSVKLSGNSGRIILPRILHCL